MGFCIICNTWQTCLRPVWARRGPCLHLADRLSRGKHLGISSISVRLLIVAQEIKSQEVVAVLVSSAQSNIHSSPVTPALLSHSLSDLRRLLLAFDCSFPTRHHTSITTSQHHWSIIANTSLSRHPNYHSKLSNIVAGERPTKSKMCFHKYTHYLKCATHVPLHTHVCPKNVTEDISRVIFCENYRAVRVNANEVCPFCSPADKGKGASIARLSASTTQAAYPSPASTVTP